MPLVDGHVFASHIGHTGKTTLCFQMSCLYAQKHPDQNVLVIDFTEEGDVTKRLLGGCDAASGKLDEVFGGIFNLINDAEKKGWLWDPELDVTKHANQMSKHNEAVPSNLYLISSGAWPRSEPKMEKEARMKLCEKIRNSLNKASGSWKLFCDTDGDRRPSDFTLIGYGLCAHAIVPLHLSKADLDRTETMLGVMDEFRKDGEIKTQVMMIVWNFVKVLKDEPMEHNGLRLGFTPTKVCVDILDACNKRVLGINKDLPGLFVHNGRSDDEFIQNSISVMKLLADNVLKPSEELGMPFVDMAAKLAASGKKSMKFKSGDVEYTAQDSVINGTDEAMKRIEEQFEAMVIS